jgi:hypothetical protein
VPSLSSLPSLDSFRFQTKPVPAHGAAHGAAHGGGGGGGGGGKGSGASAFGAAGWAAHANHPLTQPHPPPTPIGGAAHSNAHVDTRADNDMAAFQRVHFTAGKQPKMAAPPPSHTHRARAANSHASGAAPSGGTGADGKPTSPF